MIDWAGALGGAASGSAADHLAPVLRHLGCDPWPAAGSPANGGGAAHFLVGSRRGGPPRQLLARDGSVTLLFDGRLDNRVELARALGEEATGLGEPGIVLAAWRRHGEDAFATLEGPFAVAIWDETRRRLVLARDVLGGRCLSYHRPRDRHAPFLVAPDPEAILAAGVRAEANERSLARLLALRAPLPGETWYSDVEEVPPGHVVTWTREALACRRFAALEPDWSARLERDPVGRLRELLTESVSHCLDGSGVSGILLSGGLDSSAIAALAATRTPEDRRPVGLSWVFDQLPAGDDATSIASFARGLGMRWEPLVSDQLWPLGGDGTPVGGGSPVGDVYHRMQDAAFTRAQALGLKVLLCGQFGDHLWIDGGWWLRDLVARGRVDVAAAALVRQWRLQRRNEPRRGSVRGAVARLLRRRTGSRTQMPEWLTAEGSALAALEPAALAPPAGVRPEQWAAVADPLAPQGIHSMARNAARWNLEIRYPYRSRRLVEWMLGLPADRLYRPGSSKLLLRQMLHFDGFESVAAQRRPATFLPLAARGLVTEEIAQVRSLLDDPHALWSRYVRRDWLLGRFPASLAAGKDGASALVGWLCLCTEQWRRRLEARALTAA